MQSLIEYVVFLFVLFTVAKLAWFLNELREDSESGELDSAKAI